MTKAIYEAMVCVELTVPGGEESSAITFGKTEWPKQRTESSHMQSQSGSRESTLGLVPGSKLSKPISSDIVPSVRSQFLSLPDSSPSCVPSTSRLWGPSHSDHRKWNKTGKVPRRKRLFFRWSQSPVVTSLSKVNALNVPCWLHHREGAPTARL